MNNRIIFHVRKNNKLLYTLGMEYVKEAQHVGKPTEHDFIKPTLYIAWAKPQGFGKKSVGYEMVNKRLDRMIKTDKTYLAPPQVVRDNLDEHIKRAKNYFKEMPTDVMFWL